MGLRAISERRAAARAGTVFLALVLAVCGLTACRTNVGNAATIDGHRVSETDVNDYVTGSAKAIQSSDGSQSIAPKPFVLDILIEQRLYPKLLRAAVGSTPGTGQLSTLRRQYLAGSSAKAAVERLGAVGYSSAMNTIILDVQVLGTLLNQAQQEGKDLSAVVRKLKFPVSVNPRYGTWDSKTLRFAADVTSGLPGYLKLQTTSAPAS